jgi:hypothetical protein
MKHLLMIAAALLALTSVAIACSPAPSCWMEEKQSGYLRSICAGYAKDGRTLKQIAEFVDEPEKVPAFANACRKFGISFRAR